MARKGHSSGSIPGITRADVVSRTGSSHGTRAGGTVLRGAGRTRCGGTQDTRATRGGGTRGRYSHSAYWYAMNYGWTYSEATSLTGQYLDFHTYRPGMRGRADGEWHSGDWFSWRLA